DELRRAPRRRSPHLALHYARRHDAGRAGWPVYAPYDGLSVAAGAAALEDALFDQLAEGGTLVAPVGGSNGQRLLRWRRLEGELVQDDLGAVIFVPLLPGTL